MAAKDFRAGQVLTSKLIMSGGIGVKNVGLAVYSGSVSTNTSGGTGGDSALFTNVGNDVTLFVSGTAGSRGGQSGGAVLIGVI